MQTSASYNTTTTRYTISEQSRSKSLTTARLQLATLLLLLYFHQLCLLIDRCRRHMSNYFAFSKFFLQSFFPCSSCVCCRLGRGQEKEVSKEKKKEEEKEEKRKHLHTAFKSEQKHCKLLKRSCMHFYNTFSQIGLLFITRDFLRFMFCFQP